MDIDLRGVQVGMAEPFLELKWRHAFLCLVGRKGVAKRVTAHLFRNACLLPVAHHQPAYPAFRKRLTLLIQKECIRQALGSNRELRLDGLDALRLKLDSAGCHAFARPDSEGAAGKINISDRETAQFRHPDAGLEKHLQDGVVSRIRAG